MTGLRMTEKKRRAMARRMVDQYGYMDAYARLKCAKGIDVADRELMAQAAHSYNLWKRLDAVGKRNWGGYPWGSA